MIIFTLPRRLKTQYAKHRKEMSDTGQGLLDEDHEDEILPNSEITNVWGASCFIYAKTVF